MTKFDTTKKWELYLTRPFNLFGASLWHAWYASPLTLQTLGHTMSDGLFIETPNGSVRQYRTHQQLVSWKRAMHNLVISRPDQAITLLKRGEVLNRKAKHYLSKGPSAFPSIFSAVDFYIDFALHATALPYWAYLYTEESQKNKAVRRHAETLRKISLYPAFFNKIIMPLGIKHLHLKGVKNSADFLPLLTYQEIQQNTFENANSRPKMQTQKNYFVYQSLHENEQIQWQKHPLALIAQLEHREHFLKKNGQTLKGMTVFPGTVQGTARVILNASDRIKFNSGDILISINSNPSLMPYIKKASAIITDEGGITSHGAIIARELHKPCIIGTRYATLSIKNGDTVMLNTKTSSIKILKHASK